MQRFFKLVLFFLNPNSAGSTNLHYFYMFVSDKGHDCEWCISDKTHWIL